MISSNSATAIRGIVLRGSRWLTAIVRGSSQIAHDTLCPSNDVSKPYAHSLPGCSTVVIGTTVT